MIPRPTNSLVLIVATLVSLVGAIDAGVGNEWDLFAVFALVAALQLMLLTQLRAKRPLVPLRSDLVAWLRNEAALTDEPLEKLADRALAAYRAGLVGTRPGESL